MKQSRLMVALAAFTGVLVVADSAMAQQPAPAPSFAGAYTLAQVGDAELPALISEEAGCRREITAATLTLLAENKWTLEAKVKETCGDAVAEKTAKQAGSFTAAEAALEFKAADAAAAADPARVADAEANKDEIKLDVISAGKVDQNTITVKVGEKQLVFRK